MALQRVKQIFTQLQDSRRHAPFLDRIGETPQSALSLVHGPSQPELLDFTLGQILDRNMEGYGERDCCVSPETGARLTYADLSRQSKLLARGLIALGIQKGDHVGILAGNCERYIELFFGCGRIGAVLVVLNCRYTTAEAERAIMFSDCKILFTSAIVGGKSLLDLISSLLDRISQSSSHLKHICLIRGPLGNGTDGAMTFEKLRLKGEEVSDIYLADVEKVVNCYDVCNLQFTSGTTGDPKAAMLTHHNIINNGRFVGDRMELTELDVLCCPPPLFHCFGLVLGLLACITHGSSIVLPSATFSPAATLKAISMEKCTAVHGVPAMFVAELSLERSVDFDCSRLRTGIAAGSPVPPALMERVHSEFNLDELTNTYGMTETSPASFMTRTNDTLERRLTTVGTILPHTSAKVIDRNGNIVKRGVAGELCIAGYLLFKGYHKNQVKTDEVMIPDEEGILWLHTGDEVVIDDDGFCRITGRIKDIIIRGGENIYPAEIEHRLMEHPAITQASVIGVEQSRLGEVVGAFLQLRDGFSKPALQELRDFVAEKLAPSKSPAHIFWLGDEGVGASLPVTGSGKVVKTELRTIANKLIKYSDVKNI